MNWRRIKTDQSGLSIAEVVVSFMILATMMALFLVNYRATRRRSNVIVASQKLVSDLRLAQSYALGSKKINGVVPNGWGINFSKINPENTKYVIYADLDGDYRLTNNDAAVATVKLPDGVTINQNTINGSASNEINIIFSPPDPTTWVRPKTPGSTPPSSTAQAEVFLWESGSDPKSVKVNFFGLIEVGL